MSAYEIPAGDDPLVVELEDVAASAARRGHVDVYRFAMGAVALIITDAHTNRLTAEVVLDVCREYLAKNGATA